MTDTSSPAVDPEPAVEAAARQLQELTLRLQYLSQEAHFAAIERNPEALSNAAEILLPLHVEFARLYRTWLSAHRKPVLAPQTPVFGSRVVPQGMRPPGESMSV